MKEFLKRLTAVSIAGGAAYFVIGLVLAIWPETTGNVICYVAASIVLALGIIGIISYLGRLRRPVEEGVRNDLSIGLILVAVAVFIYIRSDVIIGMIPTLLGFAIVVDGLIKIQRALDLLRLKYDGWLFVMIFALFSLVLGIVVLAEPFEAARAMSIMLGISLMFSGISGIVSTILLHTKMKKTSTVVTVVEEVAEDEKP